MVAANCPGQCRFEKLLRREQQVRIVTWEQLMFFCGRAPDAFSESKRMRAGQLCFKIREPISAWVAREVEI